MIAKPKPITNVDDPRWIRAVSHPTRLRLLAMLDEDASSPVILAKKLGAPVSRIAYHVRVLHQLGLIELVSERPRRGATEHYYKTSQHPRFTDSSWEALDAISKQRLLSASLEHAYQYALRGAAAGGFDRPDAHFTTNRMKLDEQAWTELAAASKRWLEEVSAIEAAASERLARGPHEGMHVALVIQLFGAVPFSADPPEERVTERHDNRFRHSPAGTL